MSEDGRRTGVQADTISSTEHVAGSGEFTDPQEKATKYLANHNLVELFQVINIGY